jgi:hypothetical protein
MMPPPALRATSPVNGYRIHASGLRKGAGADAPLSPFFTGRG